MSIWQREFGNDYQNKYKKIEKRLKKNNLCFHRSMTFVAMMRQECSFYDDVEHSSAALSARLTGDAGNLQGVSNYLMTQNKYL